SFEFQGRPPHARWKTGKLGLALSVRSDFEIQSVKSSESVCDVDLHASGVDRLGIWPKHGYFERAAPQAPIHNRGLFGSLPLQPTSADQPENTNREQAIHGRDYS